jgi:hypothetical protein
MQSTALLTILRVFLVVLGALSVVWGIYDMFGEGQQGSVGIKKIVGGLAFASISWFVLTWAIKQVGAAEAQAGIKGCLMPMIFTVLK